MSNRRYEYMWKFLKETEFNISVTSADDVWCKICKTILIDPCIAPCSCRFCLACITEYLNGEEKVCPGTSNDCTKELLNLDIIGYPDSAAILKISRLIVNCPLSSCSFQDEVRNMQEHMTICEKRLSNCPYSNVGCQKTRIASNRISDHLDVEKESHANLLMECVSILQNDITSMKKNFAALRAEMDVLQDQNKSIQEENDLLKSEIDRNKAQCVRFMVATDQEIEKVVEESCRSHARLDQLEHLTENEKIDLWRSVNELHEKLERFNEVTTRVQAIGLTVEKWTRTEFVWRITNWSSKTELASSGVRHQIFSEKFFSSATGYRMCLSAWPNGYFGSPYLHVWFHLMRGPSDDILTWPFKGSVTLSLVNQLTGLEQASHTVTSKHCPNDHRWNRPYCDMNIGYGSDNLIELDALSGNPALCHRNVIFIKCTVRITD